MRICFVYQTEYPWDVRVEKIARTLTDAGHSVHLVCANEGGRARRETLPEAEVFRLPHLSGRLGALNPLVNFPFFFNPVWTRAIDRTVRESHAELIIVRDLPLALAAARAARRYGLPVIMDMAECYPELLRNMWQYGNFNLVNVFARNPRLADLIEKAAIRRLDHTFVMVEESRERLIAKGADPARVSIVSNTPPLEKFHTTTPARPIESGRLEIAYAGWVNRGRGLDTVVAGLGAYVQAHGRNVHLTVIGTGDGEAECKALARQLGIEDVVTFRGWQSNTEVVTQVLRSHIGLVPHHVSSHWNNTVPNKLFDYMASGLAVLTSNTRPVGRIVTETGCGLVYRDYDPQDFATQLHKLHDRQLRMQIAENGRRAVADRYNWQTDARVLLAQIENLGGKRRGAPATAELPKAGQA